ncbi:MAG: GNAT family N-acetyltransferase [Gloeomargaritaceae cyanobacterium C42_A2020_066]|nr:GNAT family N-acetyltransferase [Gloeomargaritaceae cyanobacterium C42_A2020_066]
MKAHSHSEPLPYAGSGIVLRRLRVSDLQAFQAYRTDPDLARYQGWSGMTHAEARAFLKDMGQAPLFTPGQWVQIGIAEPTTLTLLGDLGLYLAEDASHAEIGFTLARHAQGRGRATAAGQAALQLIFQYTPACKVLGITDARNTSSIGVLERIGMHKQAERPAVFRGEACVEYIYAVQRASGSCTG